MSRSLGARSLTTSSPMRSSPSVMSSRPAIIRRAVDFPHPDGPTRIMNSPSLTSRSMCLTASKPSSYRFVTSRSSICAMPSSPLHGAGGEPRDDAPLEQQDHDHDGDGDDDRRGGDRARRLLELRGARELRQRRRDRLRVLRRRQREGEDEVVPGEDEHEDRGGEDSRRGERSDDLREGLPRRRAVDLRGLLELPRNLAEERRQRVDRQRQREGHVRDDQARPRVVETDVAPDVVERPDDRDRREHRDGERRAEDEALAREVQARDGVGGHPGEDDGDHRGDERDADRVDQRAREDVLVEDRLVVLERELRRDQPSVADRRRALEREHQQPEDGKEREHEHHAVDARPLADVAAAVSHQLASPGLAVPKPLTNSTAMPTTMRKISTEIADPRPRFNSVSSVLALRIETVSMFGLLPLEMMKAESKIRNASSVRNSSATRMAGFMRGTVMRQKRCQALAPSTFAASCSSSGTSVSPASSSRAMKGVVFHTSVRMTMT